MKIRGTDFVMYQVSDLARAASFYRDVLGLPQEVFSPEWHWAEFNCGNITLALKGGEKSPTGGTGARLALADGDIQAAHEELKKNGARIVREPQDYSGCWAMEILDPDGNVVILHKRADGTCGQELSNARRKQKIHPGDVCFDWRGGRPAPFKPQRDYSVAKMIGGML